MHRPSDAEASRAGDLLSIVVPTRDREAALLRCLESLAALPRPPGGLEVVVVDDGSLRAPDETIARAIRRGLPVRMIRAAGRGPAAARNLGARTAAGRWLAFVDDDCRVAVDWAAQLLAVLHRHPRALVGGRVENDRPESVYARAHQSLLETLEGWTVRRGRPLFTSNNLAMERARFLALGGFDERFPRAAGEDFDLCDRWRDRGPLVAAPEARVAHENPSTLGAFWRVHRRYGRGSARFRRLARARGSAAGRLERPTLYAQILLEPLRRAGFAGLAEAAVLALSQAATAVGRLEARLVDGRFADGRLAEAPTTARSSL